MCIDPASQFGANPYVRLSNGRATCGPRDFGAISPRHRIALCNFYVFGTVGHSAPRAMGNPGDVAPVGTPLQSSGFTSGGGYCVCFTRRGKELCNSSSRAF